MARKLDRQRERFQAALDGKAAPDVELEAFTAFHRTTRRVAAAIARELDLNEKTVQDWGNLESGDRGPHLMLLYITQLALAMRPLAADRAACFAAIDFVEQHLGRVAFTLPPHGDTTPGGKARSIAYALSQFAEFVDSVDDPQELTPAEHALAHQQLTDVVAACFALMPADTENAR